MNIYKRAMLYMSCVTNIQRYLLKHTGDIPSQTLQDINSIITTLLTDLQAAEDADEK